MDLGATNNWTISSWPAGVENGFTSIDEDEVPSSVRWYTYLMWIFIDCHISYACLYCVPGRVSTIQLVFRATGLVMTASFSHLSLGTR